VARFHLGNGARLERINWLGNNAPRGIRESFGIMVNYLYDRDITRTVAKPSCAGRSCVPRGRCHFERHAWMKSILAPTPSNDGERPISPPRRLTPFGCIRAIRTTCQPYDERG
jgi:hypothetical protein